MLAKKMLKTFTSKATLLLCSLPNHNDTITESKTKHAGRFYGKLAMRRIRITIACFQSRSFAFPGGWGGRVIWRARKMEGTKRKQHK